MVDRLYSSKSSADKGTLFQLKELVNRKSFGKVPKNNMKATESFFEVVLFAHVIAASNEFKSETADVNELAQKIVSNFVKLTVPPPNESTTSSTEEDSECDEENSSIEDADCDSEESASEEGTETDYVFTYAVDLLTVTLLWYGFCDAIREGDGNRILRYWKFLLAIFRKEKHYNYANEGLNLLAQTMLLSPRQVCEILWSRTVNTRGIEGKNISVDLHMEHLNRRLKIMLRNLRSNINPATAQRAAKALGVVQKVCSQFMAESDITDNKDFHTIPSINKDLSVLIKQLTDSEVFKVKHERQHGSYKNYKPINAIDWTRITGWIKGKIINYNI